ncbi:MAG: hypothetical protein AABO58_04320 [Acidobacteriota bacterium]
MTVCIAAILTQNNSIALVTDQLVSDTLVSVEGFRKHYFLDNNYKWIALCEATEARRPRLMEAIQKQLDSAPGLKDKEDVIRACTAAYRSETERMHDARLSRIGYTLKTFLECGHEQLGDGIFETMLNELDGLDLGVRLLVAGFDSTGRPTLLEVSRGGEAFVPPVGYHAIGEGSWIVDAALSQFSSGWLSLDAYANVYKLCAAKFASEKVHSGSVGKDTMVLMLASNGELSFMWRMDVPELKQVWEGSLYEVPPRALEILRSKLVPPGR